MVTAIDIEHMTTEDKLRMMEELWSNLCQREDQIPVSQWHKELLDERDRLVENGQAHFVDWEAAKKQIAAKTQ